MRRRNMFHLTGLPGWMRGEFAPRAGGPGPCAQFLMTGRWPTPGMAAASRPTQEATAQGPGTSADDLPALQDELAGLKARLAELEERLLGPRAQQPSQG